jgi:cystathionine gamma-synthase
VHLVTQLLTANDLLIAPHDCYGGTYRLFSNLAKRGVVRVQFVDQTDDRAFAAALALGPKLIWIETPSNPLLRIVDIRALAQKAHATGALVLVDNTFLSPAWQRPIALGADLVLHSTTKYLNGHSDVVGGAVIASTPELHERLVWWANCTGVTGAPFDSYLTLRGLRTLHARLRVHAENAALVAHLLSGHPAVRHVYYPGPAFPSAARAGSAASSPDSAACSASSCTADSAMCELSSTGCDASRSPSRSAVSRASSRIRRR